MQVVTKFDINQKVYHTISGEPCIILAIMVKDRGYTEYLVTTGIRDSAWAAEVELTDDKVLVL